MTANHADAAIAALLASVRRHPDVEEGVACAGTKLESRTLKVRSKAFAFVRPGNLMLKLRDSLDEALGLARAEPEQFQASANGWVTVRLAAAAMPTAMVSRLRRWLDESHALFAAGAAKPTGRARAKPGVEPKPRAAGRPHKASSGSAKKPAKAKR